MPGMHWSRPAAERVLTTLRRFGWSATTDDLQRATHSMAPHSDVASARGLLEHLGVPSPRTALPAAYQGLNASGRRVYRYTLRPDVVRMIRDGLLEGRPAQTDLFAEASP